MFGLMPGDDGVTGGSLALKPSDKTCIFVPNEAQLELPKAQFKMFLVSSFESELRMCRGSCSSDTPEKVELLFRIGNDTLGLLEASLGIGLESTGLVGALNVDAVEPPLRCAWFWRLPIR